MIRIVALTGTSSENLSGMFRALLSPPPYMSDRGEPCDTEIDFADESTETLIIPYVCAQIEPSIAIICASVLTYKPFFMTSNHALASSLHNGVVRPTILTRYLNVCLPEDNSKIVWQPHGRWRPLVPI